MFELILPTRHKIDNTQFTITMESSAKSALARLAESEGMSLHKMVKAILMGYIQHKNNSKQNI